MKRFLERISLDAIVKPLSKVQPEMKLILLGTGDPTGNVHRAKPANLILAGNKTFLVDCGADTVKQMLRAKVPVERIDGVFFTHHHADHNLGFMDLLISASHPRQEPLHRQNALEVFGPTNTKEIISKIIDASSWDIKLRMKKGGKKFLSFGVKFHEHNEGRLYNQNGLKVTAFLVDHGLVKPALGYRFEYKNKVIVFSGDTRFCSNLVRHARRADILLHAAYSRHWIEAIKKEIPQYSEKLEQAISYHASTLEAAKVATQADVKHLVFTHLMPAPVPFWLSEKNWAKGANKIFPGKITVGRDLMMF